MKNKDKKPLEQRNYNFDIRAEEKETGHMIVGRPIVYDTMTNIGPFDEIIERGALDFCDLTDVRFLVNHDTSKIPLARSRRNNENSTMQLSVNDSGMDIRVNLDTENNTEAKNLYSAVQRGDIGEMSFMFITGDEKWENIQSDHPTRRITKIDRVIEVSAVTFAAYKSTEINARAMDALENARSALDNARQEQAGPVDTGEIELLKEKTKLLGGIKE